MQSSRASVAVSLLAADATALASLRPAFRALPGRLSAPHAWLARVGPDGALSTLAGCALWLVGAWLGLGLLAAIAGCLPGLAGRLSAGVGQVLLPRVAIRLLAGSAGLGVLLAPVAASARSLPAPAPGGHGPVAAAAAGWAPATTGQRPAAAAATGDALPAPSWPTDPVPSPSTADRGSVPAPIWPTSGPGTARPSPGTPTPSQGTGAPRTAPTHSDSPGRAQPAPTRRGSHAPTSPAGGPRSSAGSSPSTEPTDTTHPAPGRVATAPRSGHPTTHPPRGSQPTGSAPGETVTVRPGDSLWLIAARRLGPQPSAAAIADAWPRWYAANKRLIGSDPDLIRPGQVLHAPAPAQPEEANP